MKRLTSLLRRAAVPLLAVLTALLLGGVVIILTDFDDLQRIGTDPLGALGGAVQGVIAAYGAMLAGAFGDPGRIVTALQTGNPTDIARAVRPLTETLVSATPLIFTGLAISISFRAGMFNIGGDGQLLMGALAATTTAILLNGSAPAALILVATIAAATLAGAAWGFVPGFLKARTGAHEVITTIMLNYIAALFLTWLILQDGVQDPNRTDAISKAVPGSAQLPSFGGSLRVNLGIVLAVLVTAGVAWLLNRSAFGFELRAVGANPAAARTAGISVGRTYTLLMAVAGGLAGLGGATQVLGTAYALTPAVAGNIGFDGLLVALLGRNRPWGTLLAAILFGALRAGGNRMQSFSGISLELVTVLQALIVIFIAAPALVKAPFHLRAAPSARWGASMAKGW